MRFYIWGAFALLALGVAFWGCAGGLDRAIKTDTPAFTIQNDQGYVKRVGLGVIYAPSTPLGRESARLFTESMAATLKAEMPSLNLLTAWEAESIQAAINLLNGNEIELAAAEWRRDGFQGIATAALLDLRLVAEKTGALWFRKRRYFVRFDIVFDLYDTHTGAKLVNEIAEISLKINQDDYEALQSGTVLHISDLDDSLVDLADDIGEKAAEVLQDHPWHTSVIGVEEGRIVLAAGQSAGLQAGDRLVIYRANRHVSGPAGKFVLPGKKIAEVDIKQADEHRAYAAHHQNGAVQAGDIAMPVGR